VALSGGEFNNLDQIIAIAQIVQEGKDRQVTDQHIESLNTAVGSTEAQAVQLEEEVQKIDGTIEQMRQLVEERRKTVALAKKVAGELN
jgi:ABC-type enterochelin transport system substrate-binding protein